MSSLTLRYNVILYTVEESKKTINEIGHTYLQKLVYLLQYALNIELGYKFKLYHYGPYCPELWGDIQLLNDNDILIVLENHAGHGYDINTSGKLNTEDEIDEKTKTAIKKLISLLGGRPVKTLELLATTHFAFQNLLRNEKYPEEFKVVEIVKKLKPHLEHKDIQKALSTLKEEKLLGTN